MTTELLKTLDDRRNFADYYPSQSVINHPPLLICADKLALQNKNISDYYLDTRPIVINGIAGCEEPYNLRSQHSTELQAGYARNIDIDSELRNINFYADKCFYDRYKVDPRNPPKSADGSKPNRMACVANNIVHNYTEFRRERLASRQTAGCLTLEKFPECQHQTATAKTQLYQLPANADNNHCLNWGCQQPYNNFTKMKLQSPFNGIPNLNPAVLTCCHSS